MLWGLLLVQVAVGCPDYRCGELVAGRCAEIYGEVVFINSRTCPTGTFCWASEIDRVYRNGGQYVDCISEDLTPPQVSRADMCANYDSVYSEFRLPDVQSQPWLCVSDDDCVLFNGQQNSCVCSLSGSSYCSLRVGDKVLNDWAKSFACGNERRYDTLLNYTIGYAYMQDSSLTCEDTVEEVARAKVLQWNLPEQFDFEEFPVEQMAVNLWLSAGLLLSLN